ncbi:N-acetylmuramoyl-L-alanine amidase-like [Labeo rohita]|uniref:N-acetylmuramoyl-L-alanine amidase-like n=1 Tax=Labeo rohita TaxID=84645 RepID=UPI0021E1C1A3|nr:N-acetylmuramoyl-L-alanine amidase-like [Labeo rohita]
MGWHLRLLLSLLVVFAAEATTTMHMRDFIRAVESIEEANPGLQMLDVVKGLRKIAGIETDLTKRFLGELSDAHNLAADPSVISYVIKVIKHSLSQVGKEEGVVLTIDGSNVALAPMLLGLQAGLQSTIKGLYPLTLTDNLVASLLHHIKNEQSSIPFGTRGFWDNISFPKVYTHEDLPSLATDAIITGGMDGFILGSEAASSNVREQSLSDLLKSYYSHQPDATGLNASPRLISQNRRKNFKQLVSFSLMKSQVVQALTVRRNLNESERKRLDDVVNNGFDKFVHVYATCPSIKTRSQWGAAAYIGSPSFLPYPVYYLFIHHTYSPSRPCTTFDQCASDMRSMQQYHQQTNGWSDIGYNFVAGSDGNMYEGRGWDWVGAHAYGYNSISYGVCFIGDYTSTLPSTSAMNMVRYNFIDCAISRGDLASTYSLYGHRQADSTECPGNTLYREIQNWEHWDSYLP